MVYHSLDSSAEFVSKVVEVTKWFQTWLNTRRVFANPIKYRIRKLILFLIYDRFRAIGTLKKSIYYNNLWLPIWVFMLQLFNMQHGWRTHRPCDVSRGNGVETLVFQYSVINYQDANIRLYELYLKNRKVKKIYYLRWLEYIKFAYSDHLPRWQAFSKSIINRLYDSETRTWESLASALMGWLGRSDTTA